MSRRGILRRGQVTSGSFAVEFADPANEPTVSYPTNGKIKYTIFGDLVTLEFPETAFSAIAITDVIKYVLPDELIPEVHPDGIWKYQVIAVNHGAETIGTAIIDPADGLLQIEPDSGSWTQASGAILGFTFSYHLNWE